MEKENIRFERDPEMIPPMEKTLMIVKPLVTVTKKTHKYKRCSRGKRRNPKTHRCNKKCPAGYTRSKTSRRCVKN